LVWGTALEASQICIDYPEHNSSTAESSSMIEVQSPAAYGKGKEIVSIVPECTSQVRRSTISNKYDGFDHKNLPEARLSSPKSSQGKYLRKLARKRNWLILQHSSWILMH
jgi:hypothetical protein